jgi:2-keto-4-pentenoate hydratase/2-oxohepta-3-ene-1,7-dioic acid hydratase in catechol pathway
MRFAVLNGRAHLVSPDGRSLVDVNAASNGALPAAANSCFAEWNALREFASSNTHFDIPLDERQLDAPSPDARQVFGIGLNYRSHAEESSMDIPTSPLTFPKFPSSITSPHGDVVLSGPLVDFEAEVVAVISAGGRNITEANAWNHVAGICPGQDISDRGLQFASNPPQFGLGKSRETFSPFGPWLVSPDELANKDALVVSCALNGEEMQRASTDDLIFSIPATIEYLSSIVELYPGDVIFTGTPGGIGATRKPPRFLASGDVLTTTIDGIATITNRIVARAS